MGQRTCPTCGTTNAQNASTCSWCGRSLDDDATQPIGGPVPPPGGEQRPAAGWQRGDAAPEQPAGGSWDAAPTQQQPTGGSWEPEGPAQQPQGGAWEPASPAQPAGGSWDAAPTQQQPQGGAWEPGGEQPAGGWEPPASPAQPSGGSWEAAPSQPQGAAWEPGGQQPAGSWEQGGTQQPPASPGGDWQPGGGSWGYGQDAQASGQQAGWGAQGGAGQAQWGTPGPPAQGRRRPLLWIVLGVVALVVLVGVGIAATHIGGTVGKVARSNQPLQAPANIGGLARIDTGTIRSTLDQQSSQLRQKGAKNFVVAAYGTETQPQFVLVAVRNANDKTRQDITNGFDQALTQQPGGGTSQAQTYKQGDVEYRCTSSQLGATVAICRFNDGDVVGFGFSGTQTPQRVSQLTAEARDKMK
jgi:hypothetical protein